MRKNIRKLIKKLTPSKIKNIFIEDAVNKLNEKYKIDFEFMNISYSQEGEDLVIKRYFEGKKDILFYVDIGSHHPFRFSNTAIFYKNGSKGINIDADAELINLFRKERPNDINIHSGVGLNEGLFEFYEFKEKALSTFSQKIYEERLGKGLAFNKILKIPIQSVASILSKYNINTEIDFFNIDVEGLDFEVLQSNNWERFRPKLILVEINNFNPEDLTDQVSKFLQSKDYRFYAKTVKTVFFERIR